MFVSLYALLCAVFDYSQLKIDGEVPRNEGSAEAMPAHGRIFPGLTTYPVLSVVYGAAVFFTGFGSFVYHACGSCSLGGDRIHLVQMCA